MNVKSKTGFVAAIAILLSLSLQAGRAQNIGEVGVLTGPGGDSTGSVPVFVDRKALDDSSRKFEDSDPDYWDTMMELSGAGRLYMVDVGTRVRVLAVPDAFGRTREVRILEGEFKGRRGFVSSEWVKEK